MQARCVTEPDAIDRICATIRALWTSIDAWSRQRHVDRVATLVYSLTPEGLTLTLRDEAGWLSGAPAATLGALAAGPFDEIVRDESRRSLTLVKHCRAAQRPS
jgi:hypothetical protein